MKLINNRNITDPCINLALDEYCVRNLPMDDEYAVLYINNPSVIIGKHQNPIEESDLKFIEENKIKLVRRISGGGTVYHDTGNLNFGFITKFTQNRIHNFRYFTKPVLNALEKLGVHAELNTRSDITVNGFKVSGNAQFSNTKTVLSHGTLLYNSNLGHLSSSLKPQAQITDSRAIKSVRSKVANLEEFIKPGLSFYDLVNQIKKSLNDEFIIEDFELSDKEWKSIYDLADSRYRSWEWIFGRTPDFKIKRNLFINEEPVQCELHVKDGLVIEINFNGSRAGDSVKAIITEKLLNKRFGF